MYGGMRGTNVSDAEFASEWDMWELRGEVSSVLTEPGCSVEVAVLKMMPSKFYLMSEPSK